MASFEQAKYCPNCKRNVSATKDDRCKICGGKIERGTWSVRFRYIEEDGQEKQKRLSGFSTKKEANQQYLDFVAKHKMNNKKIHQITFSELFDEFEKYYKTKTKPSTYYDLLSKSKLIRPFFDKFEVRKISAKLILDWQNSIAKYSYNYKCHLRTILSGILGYAEKYYDIPNQLHKVDSFRRIEPKKEMQIWTPEEFNSAMAKVDKLEYKIFYTALYYTGARKGEMLATKWEDWNLKNNTLNINKSISTKISGGSWILTSPKNASSVRQIKIPKFLADDIKQLKIYEEQNQTIGEFVFGGSQPLPETCLCRYLNNAAKSAGLTPIRIHDLRHSHASLLISQGSSIVGVAKRLGHANTQQTLNTYAHLMPKDEEQIINNLEKLHKI